MTVKHKHRPCPCGCGELADECMRPSSGLNAFQLTEHGRRLASEREDLIAAGVAPSELAIPVHPDDIKADQ